MKVAIIYNKDFTGIINQFGMQNKEIYNPGTVKLVANALEKGGHNVEVINGNMHVIESLHDFMPKVIEEEQMGMVFNMAYGIQGESRYTHLPSMLEMLGIPYVGSGPSGHAIALDKVITKILMQKNNISTPDFCVFSNADEDMSHIIFPVVVKPKMEAVSFGLRVVYNEAELRDAIKFIIDEFKQQALVEQFIRGREFCVGLLGNKNPEVFPVLEIDMENDPNAIQSLEDKQKHPRGKICPANISKDLENEMIKLSRKAFEALELRDFARVDIRMDMNQNIYLLEINSMASLGLTGSYVYAAGVAGYNYLKLVNKMLEVAAARYFSKSILLQESEELETISKKPILSIRVRGFIRGRQERLEKLLKKMVNINSYVRNVDGVNELGNLVMKNLGPLGFNQQVIPQVEVGNILLFSNVPDKEYDVVLLGHLDSDVPFKKLKSFRYTEQRLYGSAIWSNKGGLAVMISALQALRFIRFLRKFRIGVLLTTDNTLRGRFAQDYVMNITNHAGVVIGLKGGGSDSTIVTSRSGAAIYNCLVSLEKAEKAEDVSKAMAAFLRLLTGWTELTNEADGLVVSPGEVEIKSNIGDLFAHGRALLSVRFNEPEQAEIIDKKIRQIATKMKRDKRLQIEGNVRRPPMLRSQGVEKLWERVKDVASKLDIRLIEEHRWSSADICFVQNGKPVIDGLGPIGADYIGEDEYILRHSLLERATLLTMLLYDLSKKPLK